MANGRVFQFGQTQKLACIPNKKAAAQTEKAMERVRARNKSHLNMFALALRHYPIYVQLWNELHELFGISV